MKSMVSPFQLIAEKLATLGFYSFFLPWLITAAVIWGLLKKSGFFGSFVNAVIALSVSFFIWGYLVTAYATPLAAPLSAFILQGSVIILVFLFALIGASMFYPKFPETLGEKTKSMIWVFIGIFVGGLFFTSGLYRVLSFGPPATGIAGDVTTLTIILVALIVGILVLTFIQGGKKGE